MTVHSYHEKSKRVLYSLLAAALALSLFGCSNKSGSSTQSTVQKGATAKSGLPTAQSALSTMAPDAKLLVVQTARAVTATSSPVWAYLFGSPSKDTMYLVYVASGRVMNASKYGKAGLNKNEWTQVPTTADWKVDSDAAYKTAVSSAGANAAKSPYMMGMQTYVPKSASTSQTTEAFTWYVSMQGLTKQIAVDAKTGALKAK